MEIEEEPLRLGKRSREAAAQLEELVADAAEEAGLSISTQQSSAIRSLFSKAERKRKREETRSKRKGRKKAKARKPSAKRALINRLRLEKKRVQSNIKSQQSKLRGITRDIRSLTGTRRNRRTIFKD